MGDNVKCPECGSDVRALETVGECKKCDWWGEIPHGIDKNQEEYVDKFVKQLRRRKDKVIMKALACVDDNIEVCDSLEEFKARHEGYLRDKEIYRVVLPDNEVQLRYEGNHLISIHDCPMNMESTNFSYQVEHTFKVEVVDFRCHSILDDNSVK